MAVNKKSSSANLVGTNLADNIYGYEGDNTLEEKRGADALDGRKSNNIASYDTSALTVVTSDFTTPTNILGEANIYAPYYKEGNDIPYGNGGDDTLIGGTGHYTASYGDAIGVIMLTQFMANLVMTLWLHQFNYQE
jgi:Ca2+-binding RTX toxin-like protein